MLFACGDALPSTPAAAAAPPGASATTIDLTKEEDAAEDSSSGGGGGSGGDAAAPTAAGYTRQLVALYLHNLYRAAELEAAGAPMDSGHVYVSQPLLAPPLQLSTPPPPP